MSEKTAPSLVARRSKEPDAASDHKIPHSEIVSITGRSILACILCRCEKSKLLDRYRDRCRGPDYRAMRCNLDITRNWFDFFSAVAFDKVGSSGGHDNHAYRDDATIGRPHHALERQGQRI